VRPEIEALYEKYGVNIKEAQMETRRPKVVLYGMKVPDFPIEKKMKAAMKRCVTTK